MFRTPYTAMSRSPYKKVSRTPYKKSLTLLTDKTLVFWYNGIAQAGNRNIEALVVAGVRKGGQYEKSAADLYPERDLRWVVGCFCEARSSTVHR